MFRPAPHILIADDEQGLRFVLRSLLESSDYKCTEAEDGISALEAIKAQEFDLAIVDIKMPGMSGMEVLEEALKVRPNLIVLVVTAYGTNELAMDAMRMGAYDYFTKPFEMQELRITIQRALEKKRMMDQIDALRRETAGRRVFPEIIGNSDAMQEVFSLMQRVIDNDVPVLITGESGTGKELVARAIHHSGPRAKQPLVKINCAAIPENLLESELFGHEKGAFTGAAFTHLGKFEQANGGTLLLDEIGEMPVALQAKILRAVQEKEVQRVGGKAPIRVDVRLLTATNRNLAEQVAAKQFREDLFFRINVIAIELPALRHRLADIPILMDYFIHLYNEKLGRHIKGVTPRVMDLMLQYGWPGNIRELENVIQRAIVMAVTPEIEPNDLPPHLLQKRGSGTGSVEVERRVDLSVPMAEQIERLIEATERRLIAEALRVCKGRQEAADKLGISRKTLHNKMTQYGMSND